MKSLNLPSETQRTLKKVRAARAHDVNGIPIPSPEDALRLIEGIATWAAEIDVDYPAAAKELANVLADVYMYAHVARRPFCLFNHEASLKRFWEQEEALVKAGVVEPLKDQPAPIRMRVAAKAAAQE